MPLVLNDEQNMLREHARGFLSKNAPIAHLRQLSRQKDATGFSRPLWKEFVDLGWAGILIPADFGGLGLGHVEVGVVMEELGRTLTPSPFLSTAVLAASAIAHAGNEKQKSAYLPKIAERRFDRDTRGRRSLRSIDRENRASRESIGQWLYPQRREDLRPRWACRRFSSSPHAPRASGRYQRADVVPGRCEGKGRPRRAHSNGGYA